MSSIFRAKIKEIFGRNKQAETQGAPSQNQGNAGQNQGAPSQNQEASAPPPIGSNQKELEEKFKIELRKFDSSQSEFMPEFNLEKFRKIFKVAMKGDSEGEIKKEPAEGQNVKIQAMQDMDQIWLMR